MVKRTVTSGEWQVARGLRQSARQLGIALFCSALVTCHSPLLLGQQPQAQGGQPVYPVNAKYVQGVGPGYWPTAGSGLALNLTAGTAYCGAPPALVSYAGGSLTLAANATNYVYLDPSANCAPASNTTGFVPGQIPLAKVSTGASSITSVTDARNWFTPLPCAMSSAGAVTCSALGANQNLNLAPSGTGKVEVSSAGVTAQELTGTDDGSGLLNVLNLYAAGGSPSFPVTVPILSFQNKTYGNYFGDIEGDNRGAGLMLYGAGASGFTTIRGDGEIDVIAGSTGTNKDIVLTPGGTGSVLVSRLNNIRFANQFSGGDPGAKTNACIADTPVGGTCNALGLSGAVATTINVNKGITLILPAGLTATVAPAVKTTADNVAIQCMGSGTNLAGGAAGPLMKLGASGAEVSGQRVIGCNLNPGDGGTGTRNGLDAYIHHDLLVEDVSITDADYGLDLFGVSGVSTSYNLVRVKIDTTYQSGMNISTNASDGFIDHPVILNTDTSVTPNGGIFLTNNSGYLSIISPLISNSGNNCIYGIRDNVTITDPQISECGNTASANGDAIRIEGLHDSVIGGRLDGATSGLGGNGINIYGPGSADVGFTTISGTQITNMKGAAIEVHYIGTGTAPHDVDINGIHASSNVSNCVYVDASSSNVHVNGGTCRDNGNYGVHNYGTGDSVLNMLFQNNTGGPYLDETGGNLLFWGNRCLTTACNQLLPGGNVGLGVSSPTYKLEVSGAIKQGGVAGIGGYLRANSTNLASSTALNPGVLVYGGGTGQAVYGEDIGYNAGTGRFRNRMFFYGTADMAFAKTSATPPAAQSDFTDLMVIRGDSGNVGIGTAAPSLQFQVSKSMGAAVNTLSFSSTPTFDASLGNTQKLALTGDVTSSTLSNAVAGEVLYFIICQDATGGRAFAWPSNFLNAPSINTGPNQCKGASFVYDGAQAIHLE
jgi:hypothetical protein